jgi:hypothetical protein
MKPQNPPESTFEVEIYKQTCENCRFYGDMRFKQLTLFGVIYGLLLNVLKDANTPGKVLTICSIGMIATTVLWIMEVRSFVHWLRAASLKEMFEGRAIGEAQLEKATSNKDAVPKWTLVNASNAVLLLYLISYLFWYVLFLGQLSDFARISSAVIFGLGCLFLLVFSVIEYQPAFRHARSKWEWW